MTGWPEVDGVREKWEDFEKRKKKEEEEKQQHSGAEGSRGGAQGKEQEVRMNGAK